MSEHSIEVFTKGRLTKAKAAELTQAIRRQSVGLWLLVKVAHDREAWRVLGYDSFKAYVDAELHITEQRAYQLVDLGKVVDALQRGLTRAGYDVQTLELAPPPARVVAVAKHHLDEVEAAALLAAEELGDGEVPGVAVLEAVREVARSHQRPGEVARQRTHRQRAAESSAPPTAAPVKAAGPDAAAEPVIDLRDNVLADASTVPCPTCGTRLAADRARELGVLV